MKRFLLLGLLALATAADAAAQTKPASANRTTAPRSGSAKRTAPARTAAPSRMGGAQGSTATADGKGQGVYAAPGEPVNIQTTPVSGYDGPAARRKKPTTTLNPK